MGHQSIAVDIHKLYKLIYKECQKCTYKKWTIIEPVGLIIVSLFAWSVPIFSLHWLTEQDRLLFLRYFSFWQNIRYLCFLHSCQFRESRKSIFLDEKFNRAEPVREILADFKRWQFGWAPKWERKRQKLCEVWCAFFWFLVYYMLILLEKWMGLYFF